MGLSRFITPERARFIRFCVVGASGVVVNLVFFSLVYLWLLESMATIDKDLRFLLANLVGFLISVFTNFLLNDYWTWGDRAKHHDHFWRRLGAFYLVSSVAGVVQLGVAQLVHVSFHVIEQLAVLVGIGVATIINFVANNVWTFKEGADPSPPADRP